MTVEGKHLRQDGCEHKFGEYGEEHPGGIRKVENWQELNKEEDNYNEYKSEKITLYPKKLITSAHPSLEDPNEPPRMVRSGLKDYKNNRNYYYAEQWEEYIDGTILKKMVLDNGYSEKTMEESGMKFNVEKMESLAINLDQCGYFICYLDKENNFEYKSLGSLMEKNKQYLEYEYTNTTNSKSNKSDFTIIKKGIDYTNKSEWNNVKTWKEKD